MIDVSRSDVHHDGWLASTPESGTRIEPGILPVDPLHPIPLPKDQTDFGRGGANLEAVRRIVEVDCSPVSQELREGGLWLLPLVRKRGNGPRAVRAGRITVDLSLAET